MQVGNGLTDDFHDHMGLFQFLWSTGMISDQTFKKLNVVCDFQSFIQPSEECDKVLDIASEEIGNIDQYSIFTPACTVNFGMLNHFFKRPNVSLNLLSSHCHCQFKLLVEVEVYNESFYIIL